MAQIYNIKGGMAGDTYNGVQFTYTLNESPIDLTGAAIKIQFNRNSKGGKLLKTLEVGSGITIVDAVNGIFSIDPFVIDLPVGHSYYDVQLTKDGVVKTYVEGKFTTVKGVTQ